MRGRASGACVYSSIRFASMNVQEALAAVEMPECTKEVFFYLFSPERTKEVIFFIYFSLSTQKR